MLVAHVRQKDLAATLPKAKATWIDFTAVAGESGGGDGAGAKPKILPVVVEFNDDGVPVTKQMDDECYDKELEQLVVLPVAEWHRSAPAAALDTDQWHQSVIACVMAQHHKQAQTTQQPLQIQYDFDKNKYLSLIHI